MDYEYELRDLAPQPMLSVRGRTRVVTLSDTIGEYLREVWDYIQARGEKTVGPPFTRYHGVTGDEVDLEAGLPVAASMSGEGRIRAGELPGGEAVVTTHIGPYEGLPQAGHALEEWARQHGREAAGPNWELYITDPGEAPDPMTWRTEVYKPLKPLGADRP